MKAVTAQPRYFVERNQLQIGLSAGRSSSRGDVRSGTMTQAAFCARERRPLFAIAPDEDLGLLSAGPMQLIQQDKAIRVRSKDDYSSVLAAARQSRDEIIRRSTVAPEVVPDLPPDD